MVYQWRSPNLALIQHRSAHLGIGTGSCHAPEVYVTIVGGIVSSGIVVDTELIHGAAAPRMAGDAHVGGVDVEDRDWSP